MTDTKHTRFLDPGHVSPKPHFIRERKPAMSKYPPWDAPDKPDTKHTPTLDNTRAFIPHEPRSSLPWGGPKSAGTTQRIRAINAQIHDAGGHGVADLRSAQDGAHIVRCVNSHAELIAALEQIAHSAECNGGGFLTRADLLNVVRSHGEQARAALAKVAK